MTTDAGARRHQGFVLPDGAPPGFAYLADFLSRDEEASLLGELASLDWDGAGVFRRRGQVVRRRELDFLQAYARNARTLAAGRPLPAALASLRARIATRLAMEEAAFGQVIAALYRPGAGIDWHTDAAVFGAPICGVSLGGLCSLQLRASRVGPIWSLAVDPRSLYVLEGAARWEWQHRIPPLKETRFSVTLRALGGR